MCREPRRAVDTFPALFKSKITQSNLIMATGESIAHLNYLLAAGRLGALWEFAASETNQLRLGK